MIFKRLALGLQCIPIASGMLISSWILIPNDCAYGDSHPSLYEGNHRDYHFPLLPLSMSIPFFTVSNEDSWGDSILSFKALYTLCRVYQVSESTHEGEMVEGKKKTNEN